MSALYAIHYLGQGGVGSGALYVGKGIIAGIDIGGGRYDGTYIEEGGHIKGKCTLTFIGGGYLVTGQQMQPGTTLPLTVDWPANFTNGQALPVNVAGRVVQVTFEKLKDIP